MHDQREQNHSAAQHTMVTTPCYRCPLLENLKHSSCSDHRHTRSHHTTRISNSTHTLTSHITIHHSSHPSCITHTHASTQPSPHNSQPTTRAISHASTTTTHITANMGLLRNLPQYLLTLSLLISLILLATLLALSPDGRSLSFTTFYTDAPDGRLHYYLGYVHINECWTSHVSAEYNSCTLQSLADYDKNLGGVCERGGTGMIVSYSLAMAGIILTAGLAFWSWASPSIFAFSKVSVCRKLFSIASIVFLLSVVTCFLTLLPLTFWYANCHSTLAHSTVTYMSDPNKTHWPVNDVKVSSGIGMTIAAALVQLIGVVAGGWQAVREWRDAGVVRPVHNAQEAMIDMDGKGWGKLKEVELDRITVFTSSSP